MLVAKVKDLESIDFGEGDGLVPVIAQHALTGECLMLAYANREALTRTLRTQQMWYFSRSRNRLWHKGETSGNVQRLVSLHADCDADAVLARIEPTGPSCHTGDWSCFEAPPTLAGLARTLRERTLEAETDAPTPSYTRRLLGDRNLRLKKLGEEMAELITALADGQAERIAEETADVLYHTLVAALGADVQPERVLSELERRRGGG